MRTKLRNGYELRMPSKALVGQALTERELKERVRRWIVYFLRHYYNNEQVTLAQTLGLSAPTISNLVNGKVRPGFRTLSLIHFKLHQDVAKMLATEPPGGAQATTRSA